MGAQQHFRVELTLWVADEDPADGHGRKVAVIPDGRLLAALRVTQPPSEGGQPLALQARLANHAGAARQNGLVEVDIQPHASDHGDRARQSAATAQQRQAGKAAVGQDDHRPVRQPTLDL